jgi:hypothetical protein
MVTLQVTHMSGLDDGAGHLPFYAFADSSGGISAQWYVDPDDSLHSIFVLTAVGATSGRQATTIFTDAFFFNNDDGGVDDINSNQVDLNQMGTDEVNLPTTLGVKFNWDDTVGLAATPGMRAHCSTLTSRPTAARTMHSA